MKSFHQPQNDNSISIPPGILFIYSPTASIQITNNTRPIFNKGKSLIIVARWRAGEDSHYIDLEACSLSEMERSRNVCAHPCSRTDAILRGSNLLRRLPRCLGTYPRGGKVVVGVRIASVSRVSAIFPLESLPARSIMHAVPRAMLRVRCSRTPFLSFPRRARNEDTGKARRGEERPEARSALRKDAPRGREGGRRGGAGNKSFSLCDRDLNGGHPDQSRIGLG